MIRFLLAALLLLSPLADAATDIGVASAVRGAVNATAPGSTSRSVTTGKSVYQNDKVVTGADAQLQILLLDETSFTVGANSEMVLDDFVFDPATNAGKVSARVAKGTFRFITGKVARKDPESMKVKLAVGTIGIRGTMVAGTAGDKEATIVLLGPGLGNNADEKGGAFTVSNQYGSTDVDKDGWGVTVKDGQAPSAPFQLAPGQLDGILSGVGSAPKGDAKDDSDADGGAAGEQSGQDTAQGKSNLTDAFAAFDSAQSETSAFASQQFTAFKASKWEAVRGITSGTGRYIGSSQFFSCSGSNCTTPAGTASLDLFINFGAQTFGGSGSQLVLGSVATGTIASKSYSGFTGDATYNFVNGVDIIGGTNWTGTSLKLLDSGDATATSASVDIKYFDGSTSLNYAGEVTGTR